MSFLVLGGVRGSDRCIPQTSTGDCLSLKHPAPMEFQLGPPEMPLCAQRAAVCAEKGLSGSPLWETGPRKATNGLGQSEQAPAELTFQGGPVGE